jgi:probable F420-dependent oxidoreductase
VRIGFHLPQWGAGATRESVLAVARVVEDAGLDSVWVADHIVYPMQEGGSEYPGGQRTFAPEDGWLEAFGLLSLAAGATERIQLGTSVLVASMRDTLTTAKVAATLDALSGGRLLLGVGVGWWREEYEALGKPFDKRGRILEEQLRALPALWSGEETSFDGEYVSFERVVCRPVPHRRGGPPVLVGGMGKAALRRAGQFGDGWHALGVHEPTLVAGWEAVKAHAVAVGRDPSQLTLSTSSLLVEDDEKMLRRLIRLAQMGVVHVALTPASFDAGAFAGLIERFAERLLPRLRAEIGSAEAVSGA